MKKLVIVLIVVGVLLALLIGGLLIADYKVREAAETEAEKRIRAAVPQAKGGGDIEIDAFPFVLGVLISGKVSRIVVDLRDVTDRGVSVESVHLEVDGLAIDRDLLLDKQQLAVTGIDRASLSARVTAAAASKVIGRSVDFSGNKVHVEIEGRKIAAGVRLKGRNVLFEVAGFPPLVVPLPQADVLPCEPAVEIAGGALELACSITALPDAVKKALSP